MRTFSNTLLSDLENQLIEIHNTYENPIQYSEYGIKISNNAIKRLKAFFSSYQFENKAEEIEFFKKIKPEFASRLIYYNEIYKIEAARPAGSGKVLRKYYKSQQLKLKQFHAENADFYKYYRTNSTVLDKKYFLRHKHDIRLALESSYFQSDYDFTTSHDYKVAWIKATDNIQHFLENRMKAVNGTDIKAVSGSALKWTGTKVALVELLYALNTARVFNDGNSTLAELAKHFEASFGIDLGQFNRSYLEIRNRKTIDKTHFLNTLREKLVTRMDAADEKG